jgi:hypothetical protein
MTVPVRNTPASGEIISSGVPDDGTLAGTIGLQDLNINGLGANNLTRTMIVGYLTDINYEGAILKHNIW